MNHSLALVAEGMKIAWCFVSGNFLGRYALSGAFSGVSMDDAVSEGVDYEMSWEPGWRKRPKGAQLALDHCDTDLTTWDTNSWSTHRNTITCNDSTSDISNNSGNTSCCGRTNRRDNTNNKNNRSSCRTRRKDNASSRSCCRRSNTPGKHVLWIVLIALFFLLHASSVGAIDMWWQLGMSDVLKNPQVYILGATPICTQLKGLSAGQVRFCQKFNDHMPSIGRGAKMAIGECQWQFRFMRWNCSTVADSSVFGPVISIASREAAFTHAISAAGVVHAISRSCREGNLHSCHCSRAQRPRNLDEEWIWGGCGDNIEYGYRFAKAFVDVREQEKTHPRHSPQLARMLMNKHNNEGGRKAVYNYAKVACKCHGVSGSCALKTCWQQLPTFREIGDRLRDRYNGATEVRFNRRGTRLVRKVRKFNKPTREDLIYMEASPDYCVANATTGSQGTKGRLCIRNGKGMEGCDLMCCGRGYNTYKQKLVERCHCKFFWCCYVKCKTCERIIDVHTCK